VQGFLERPDLPLDELWLMDNDPRRLEVVGGFTQRMLHARGSPFQVRLTSERRAALQGASYVITQLRVGGNAARREDEYLGRRHGLIGQETTGVGGIASALRTIPIVLEIAEELHELAPQAWLINFTNPAGLVTEALQRHAPQVRSVGLCNNPIVAKMRILHWLNRVHGWQAPAERAALDGLGLNHLSWYRGFSLDGQDLLPEVLAGYRQFGEEDWGDDLLHALGMIPNSYLQYYYFTTERLDEQQSWPPSRAEVVQRIEAGLLRRYADPRLTSPPPELRQRGGAYYSTLATQLINCLHNDLGQVHVVNVPQGGAVPTWPADWVLELPCRVDAAGIQPLPAEPLPPACYGLLAMVKMVELLTIQAAVGGDRQALFQALLTHPLGPPARRVRQVLEDLLHTNRPYLPRFWSGQASQPAQ